MASETEKYYQRKNRDLRFARWFVAIFFGIPIALALGTCVGLMVR